MRFGLAPVHSYPERRSLWEATIKHITALVLLFAFTNIVNADDAKRIAQLEQENRVLKAKGIATLH